VPARIRIGLLVGSTLVFVLLGLGALGGQWALTPATDATPSPPPAEAPAAVEAMLKAEMDATGTAFIAAHDATRTVEVAEAQARTATASVLALTATALARPNQLPVITRFVAEFVADDRSTYYEVEAVDPDGDSDDLKYEWSNTNPCGTFSWAKDEPFNDEASWLHPHPPCPNETFHPAIIAVRVTDTLGGQSFYEYTGGSQSSTIDLTPFP
jgi:hypothetical protein